MRSMYVFTQSAKSNLSCFTRCAKHASAGAHSSTTDKPRGGVGVLDSCLGIGVPLRV